MSLLAPAPGVYTDGGRTQRGSFEKITAGDVYHDLLDGLQVDWYQENDGASMNVQMRDIPNP